MKTGVIILPTQTSCTIIGEIPPNHHTFALFDPRETGNLMTPGKPNIESSQRS